MFRLATGSEGRIAAQHRQHLVGCFCVLLCHTTWLTCTFLSFLFSTTSTPGNCCLHLPSELCCDSCHKPRFHFRFVKMVKCVKRRNFWWVKIPGRLLVFSPLRIFSPAICRHCSVPAQGKARSAFMMQGLFVPPFCSSAVLWDRALEFGSGNMQINPQGRMFLNKGERWLCESTLRCWSVNGWSASSNIVDRCAAVGRWPSN